MKVQCDVCAADAASVFCCADEAALCDACDRRVHRANKLAGKHRRFSLLNPSSSQMPPPLCDICQEKRGFLFCKEDRAILCRECDMSVHTASELSMRHARFLLTGVRVSSEPASSPAPPEEEEENTSSLCCSGDDDAAATSHGASSGSSISEYLTKTLPGWHVEDFLVDDATAAANAAAAASAGFSSGGSYQGAAPNFALHEAGYQAGSGWMRQEHWVPQMYAELAGGKRSRTSATNPRW
ncbi:B-box zinc finger protein 20-like [Hordeum vulgare]|uniref:B box-type domain-containing protein n=1 Tax=Hordeum vulgare subsp. vulgare TaxID=112509 RepID=A0A8I6YDX9_HORVV|nr:B-box zinc finger protein 21-like [Hordeum vulgare subsp. vulgare]KAE8791582.1 B-box zinc finger protein 20-like [Hordeum vulgare]KAI4980805.1 hypothetical protein ZWY2020_021290 [Hordeum vulgare]